MTAATYGTTPDGGGLIAPMGCVGIIPNGGATSTTRTCGVRLGGGGEQANGADWSMVERRNNVQA